VNSEAGDIFHEEKPMTQSSQMTCRHTRAPYQPWAMCVDGDVEMVLVARHSGRSWRFWAQN